MNKGQAGLPLATAIANAMQEISEHSHLLTAVPLDYVSYQPRSDAHV